MRTLLKKILKKSPTAVLEAGESIFNLFPPRIKYGRSYTEAMSLLEASQFWDIGQLEEYQNARLRKLITHAYKNVPYYNKVMRERGITPKDINTVYDLEKLPFLTKDIVRNNLNELTARNSSGLHRESVHTSGSTGTPLNFYIEGSTRSMERALVQRHLHWLGFQIGEKSAFFKGTPLANKRKLYKYFPGLNEMRVTFHKSSEDKLNRITEMLTKFKPKYINAWPSCLYILGKHIEKTGKRFPAPQFIVTSSETHFPHINKFIEEIFQAPVIDWYGQEEMVAVAAQCGFADAYHIQMEAAVIETMPVFKDMVEIVGTCLHNFAQPFIRYKTGDLGIVGNQGCPCGRNYPTIKSIIGRQADFVLTSSGQLISPLILHFAFYDLLEIKEAQIVQEDIHTLRVLISSWTAISENTKQRLFNQLLDVLETTDMKIIFEDVPEIPKEGQSQKHKFVISKIPQDVIRAQGRN